MDFNKIIRETCGETYDELYADGVHLSKQGGELLINNLLPIIKKNIGDELIENFPDFMSLKREMSTINQ